MDAMHSQCLTITFNHCQKAKKPGQIISPKAGNGQHCLVMLHAGIQVVGIDQHIRINENPVCHEAHPW